MARMMVIEEDPMLRTRLMTALRVKGHEVEAYETGREALARWRHAETADVVLVDVLTGDTEARRSVHRVKAAHPKARVVAMAEVFTTGTEVELRGSLGAEAALRKPFGLVELYAAVDQAQLAA